MGNLNNTEIEILSLELKEAINSFIIDSYGMNPLYDFDDIEEVLFHKIHEKYGQSSSS